LSDADNAHNAFFMSQELLPLMAMLYTARTTDIKTIDYGFSKNSEAQKMSRPSPHMHDKYLIYFELQASLIWFAQQKVVRLQLHDLKLSVILRPYGRKIRPPNCYFPSATLTLNLNLTLTPTLTFIITPTLTLTLALSS